MFELVDSDDDDGQPEQDHVAADLGGGLRQPEAQERAVAEDREGAVLEVGLGVAGRRGLGVDGSRRSRSSCRSPAIGSRRRVSAGSPRSTKPASRRSSARRSRSTWRPQPWQRSPMSAPSRSTSHVSPPHGCGRRRRTTSPSSSGRTGRVGHRRAGYQSRGRPWTGTSVRSVAGSSRRSTGVTSTTTSGWVAASWAMIPPDRVSDPVSLLRRADRVERRTGRRVGAIERSRPPGGPPRRRPGTSRTPADGDRLGARRCAAR